MEVLKTPERKPLVKSKIPSPILSSISPKFFKQRDETSDTLKVHLTSSYKEKIIELNNLQRELYAKKNELDLEKDQIFDLHQEYNFLRLHFDKLQTEKLLKNRKYRNQFIDFNSCSKEQNDKIKVLNEGYELNKQQLRIENDSKISALLKSYKNKIDNLKTDKILSMQESRDELLNEVERVNNEIRMLNYDEKFIELENEYQVIKREQWLENHQMIWKKTISQNEMLTNESFKLEKKLTKLKKNYQISEKSLLQLQNQISSLKARDKEICSLIANIRREMNTKNLERDMFVEQTPLLTKKISDLNLEMKRLDLKFKNEETLRRQNHNKIQELRGNIRVYCRLRPYIKDEEIKHNSDNKIQIFPFNSDEGNQSIIVKQNSLIHGFKFDKIFDKHDDNYLIFEEIKNLIQSSLDGYNVCIFTYGQTGSGKTYTMLNDQNGIVLQTINYIINFTNKLSELGWEYQLEMEFIEIYNETIKDLFAREKKQHTIRHDNDSNTTEISNTTKIKINLIDYLKDNTRLVDLVNELITKGNKIRNTNKTTMNENSSRSHSIFIISITGQNKNTNETCTSKLNLIDLAGSERINNSEIKELQRLKETKNINKSLSSLGDVIHNMKQQNKYIPFRNSKLTYLLKHSLQNQSKTLMFVNISPNINHLNETTNSLRFAKKVNNI